LAKNRWFGGQFFVGFLYEKALFLGILLEAILRPSKTGVAMPIPPKK
jgi:hypothetical protein